MPFNFLLVCIIVQRKCIVLFPKLFNAMKQRNDSYLWMVVMKRNETSESGKDKSALNLEGEVLVNLNVKTSWDLTVSIHSWSDDFGRKLWQCKLI